MGGIIEELFRIRGSAIACYQGGLKLVDVEITEAPLHMYNNQGLQKSLGMSTPVMVLLFGRSADSVEFQNANFSD